MLLFNILQFLIWKKAIQVEEDVLGYKIEQFIKYKNSDILKNLLIKYSNCLIDPEYIQFDQYYDEFEAKFKHLFEDNDKLQENFVENLKLNLGD